MLSPEHCHVSWYSGLPSPVDPPSEVFADLRNSSHAVGDYYVHGRLQIPNAEARGSSPAESSTSQPGCPSSDPLHSTNKARCSMGSFECDLIASVPFYRVSSERAAKSRREASEMAALLPSPSSLKRDEVQTPGTETAVEET